MRLLARGSEDSTVHTLTRVRPTRTHMLSELAAALATSDFPRFGRALSECAMRDLIRAAAQICARANPATDEFRADALWWWVTSGNSVRNYARDDLPYWTFCEPFCRPTSARA